MNLITQILLITLPILTSGIIFIFILKKKWFMKLRKPIDFGRELNGMRVFGDHKTFLGFIVMGLATSIFGILFFPIYNEVFNLNFDTLTAAVSFLILGLAYSVGELPNSFIKRQLGIAPGHKAVPEGQRYFFEIFDLIDSLIFVGIVYFLIFNIDIAVLLIGLFTGALIHWSLDQIMHYIKLKKK